MGDDAKPEVPQLNITVKSQDGDQVQFKVKATTKFEKVLIPFSASTIIGSTTL